MRDTLFQNTPYKIMFCIAVAIVSLSPLDVWAHPHCYILNSVHFIFDSQGLDRVDIDWQFDEFTTAQILSECDTNGDNTLDPEEMACIKAGYFDSLTEYNHFTYIKVDGLPIETPRIEDLNIELIEGFLLYNYSIQVQIPAKKEPREVRAALYDETFYCAMEFPEELPVLVENQGPMVCKIYVHENLDESYYFEQINPWEAVLTFRLPTGEDDQAVIIASPQTPGQPSETGRENSESPSYMVLGPEPSEDEIVVESPPEARKKALSFTAWIMEKQKIVYQHMADLSKEIKEQGRMAPLALLLLLAFLYGFIHAAGPGHGKAFAASFVLAKGPNLKQALQFGNLIALFHGLSAVVLVVLLKTSLTAFTGQSLDRVEYVTKISSYSLIALIGLLLIYRAVLDFKRPHVEGGRFSRSSNIWVTAAFIGLVPCPGVALVLLFSLSLGIFWVGMLMALFQTLGMAVTISLVTISVVAGKRGGFRLFTPNPQTLPAIEAGIQSLAGFGVFSLGFAFLIGVIAN